MDRLRHRTPLAPVNCGVATPYLTGADPLCCSHRSRTRVRSCAVHKRRAPLPQTDRLTALPAATRPRRRASRTPVNDGTVDSYLTGVSSRIGSPPPPHTTRPGQLRCGHPVLDRGRPPVLLAPLTYARAVVCRSQEARTLAPDRQTDCPPGCDTAAPSRLPHPGQRRDYRLVLDRGLMSLYRGFTEAP